MREPASKPAGSGFAQQLTKPVPLYELNRALRGIASRQTDQAAPGA